MKHAIIIVLLVLAAGCSTGNLTKLNERTVYSRTSDAQVASMDADGNLQAAYHGIGPMQLMQDPNGNWTNMPGPAGILSFPTPQGIAFIVSPNNMNLDSFTYTPNPSVGAAAITINGLNVNISEPMSQQTAAIAIALPILQAMSHEDALLQIEKWKASSEMVAALGPGVLDLLAKIFVP